MSSPSHIVGVCVAVLGAACDSPGGGLGGGPFPVADADVRGEGDAEVAEPQDGDDGEDGEDGDEVAVAVDAFEVDEGDGTADSADTSACVGHCELWESSCSGPNGFKICAPDPATGCGEPSFFIGCHAGNTCTDGVCVGACVVPELVLLVDRSSSMAGALWDGTRAELIAFAEALEPGLHLGFRTFPGADACTPSAVTPPAETAAAAFADALTEPATISATPLAAAFDGLALAFGDPAQGEHVIVVTDGSETCGDVNAVVTAASRLRARGTIVHAIGLGPSFDSELLQALATAGGGTLWQAPDRAALHAALKAVATTITGCAQPNSGLSYCQNGTCDVQCDAGWHVCADSCVTNDDVAHCGNRCEPCPARPNARVSCDGSRCNYACESGYHACGETCRDNASPEACGDRCAPCPDVANAEATCVQGQCDFVCDPGFHACGGACVADTSTATCGDRCAPCADDPHGAPTCDGTMCGTRCDNDFHLCGASCASDDALATCGTRCSPCPTPPHGVGSCVDETCRLSCEAGRVFCDAQSGCCKRAISAAPTGITALAVSATGEVRAIVGGADLFVAANAVYHRKTATGWVAETVPGGAAMTVGAFDAAAEPVILRWATLPSGAGTRFTLYRQSGGNWVGRSFDDAEDGGASERSIAIDDLGTVHVFYYTGDFSWVWNHRSIGPLASANDAWSNEVVIGAGDFAAAAAIGPGREPALAFYAWDFTNTGLYLTRRGPAGFDTELLYYTSGAGVSTHIALAFDALGQPHILADGQDDWISLDGTLESAGCGVYSSILGFAYDRAGAMHVLLGNYDAPLQMCRWDGEAWVAGPTWQSPESVASGAAALAFEPDNDPVAAWDSFDLDFTYHGWFAAMNPGD